MTITILGYFLIIAATILVPTLCIIGTPKSEDLRP